MELDDPVRVGRAAMDLARERSEGCERRSKGWPDPPELVAFAGLASPVITVVDPFTEADRVAVLLQFLTAFSNAIGRRPHCMVGATRHALNLFSVLVGDSAKARKGDSWQPVRHLFTLAEPVWSAERVMGGLSSGEGLIWEVRDPVLKGEETVDEGVRDKRLLVHESEFARVLKVMTRQGSILSTVLREAWDSGSLRLMTKNSPARATGAHIAIVGHITVEELRRELTDVEAVNGFANRFLWAAVRRSKLLPEPEPFGGAMVEELAREIATTVRYATAVDRIERSPEAIGRWAEIYADLAEAQPGLVGSITARAEAQILRLSALYALLDRTRTVQPAHLESALALWRFSERSVRHIFGDALGDPVADTILRALRQDGELSRTEISALFGRHEPAKRIDHALEGLRDAGKAR